MREKLSLYIFIDALGWQVLQKSYPQFCQRIAPHRKPLRTILGYSSACDPSIISGKLPSEHLHWSCFYYSPQTSPFRKLAWMKWIPKFVRDQHRFRHWFSRWFAQSHGYTGYFQLYEVPFDYLQYFDYSEKKWIYGRTGLLQGKTLFDDAIERKIPHFVTPLFSNDTQTFENLKLTLKANTNLRFAYLLLGNLDALMHGVGTESEKIRRLLQWYEAQIEQLIQIATSQNREVSVHIFSDHGMHDVINSVDLEEAIKALPLEYGIDYVAMYDSTMARLWYLTANARSIIENRLEKIPQGRILDDDELKHLGVFFPDRRYGETIFLMQSGQLIIPSYMGIKIIPGMHGYHPDDPDSDAVVLSNQPIPEQTTAIQHLHEIFMRDLDITSSKSWI